MAIWADAKTREELRNAFHEGKLEIRGMTSGGIGHRLALTGIALVLSRREAMRAAKARRKAQKNMEGGL